MIWFNPNNTSDLPVLVLDDLPQRSTFVSVNCQPMGISTCSAVFNPGLNRIEITAIIGPDFGAPTDADVAVLNNEITVTLVTNSIQAGNSRFTNIGEACWDYNNSGSAEDDYLAGQDCIQVDARVDVSIPIPLFDHWARLLAVLMLLTSGLFMLRQRSA